LQHIARRVQDAAGLHLVKQILKAGGKIGVPQGGPLSPLAANIYLSEVDWAFDGIRRQTAQGPYEAVNYHRFADDSVLTVSGHHTKRGWATRALQRLHEHLARLRVEVNLEKTKVVDLLRGEAFEFLGFELRRVTNRAGDGQCILLTPRKKARLTLKARARETLRRGGATPLKERIAQLNTVLQGWVQYFRVGNASRAFSEMRDYVEMKVRSLLTRRKRRRKRSVGWRRWSNEHLYDVPGLFWDWTLRPLPSASLYQ
jgi:RNA-directed DNA polymerase